MHGIIFQQLQQFVNKNYGSNQWIELLESANLGGKFYMPTQVYDDSEVVSLVVKASEITGRSVQEIMESFGEFIAPSLLKIYSASIKSDWSTIDLLEHVENTIHKAVRFADKNASPPELDCKRKSPTKVVIDYTSKRKMIDVGVGIIKGIAKIKNERIEIKRTDLNETSNLEVSLIAN
jgi:hypothetical protein